MTLEGRPGKGSSGPGNSIDKAQRQDVFPQQMGRTVEGLVWPAMDFEPDR